MIFSSYYQTLLSDPSSPNCPSSQTWLDSLPLPKLTEKQLQLLNAPCKEEEIASIISLKSSKTPGLDGYTAPYYKKFAGILVPKMAKLYNLYTERGIISR